MNMILSVLTLPVGLFLVFVGLIVSGVRRAVEAGSPSLKRTWWWRDLVLVFAPILFGALLAVGLGDTYPLPEFVKTPPIRVMVGSVLGGISGFFYRIFMTLLRKKADSVIEGVKGSADLDDDQETPAVRDAKANLGAAHAAAARPVPDDAIKTTPDLPASVVGRSSVPSIRASEPVDLVAIQEIPPLATPTDDALRGPR